VRPLEDIRVVAVEQYGAGPFGSLHLADLGADVIKIEDPSIGGDVGRYVPPFQEGEDSLFFQTFNRNKRSISLDLRSESGRGVFEDLVESADVVYSNLRGDVPDRLQIRYPHLSHLNPAIVCVSLSGFGMTGPRSHQPGYDYLLQGLAGWMTLTGDPAGPPAKSGLSVVDYCGGLIAAFTVLAAVHAARRDGVGSDCDLSLYDVATSLLTYEATWYLNEGRIPERQARSAHPSLVPFQLFAGRDERWFVVACAKEKFWVALTDALGAPALAQDDRFSDFAARFAHRTELIALLDDIFATAAAAHWVSALAVAGVPVSAVQTIPEAMSDPHTIAREMVIEVPHEGRGTVRELRTAAQVGTEAAKHLRAPRRGEHTAEILAELGYTAEQVMSLQTGGAFGDPPGRDWTS
jgi:crotonobetainyl-CoA:carnitine CoA-transferase CaiB-like acyl-CoA transferase